jgi:molybdate transport system ATP-binding protein
MIEIAVAKRLHTDDGEIDLSVEMAIAPRQLVTVFGKSGVGKTTLLHMIAGLVAPDKGRIRVNGRLWFDSARRIDLAPSKRRIGMVFQDYALFPNMTVRKNLEFALRAEGDDAIVNEMLRAMALEEFQDRYPALLSGGQKQRVALARALVSRPELLLLDEPLSALDPAMRRCLQELIAGAHGKFDLTTVLVSHDADEIIKLSDRVWVLDKGKAIDAGKPEELFGRSAGGPGIEIRGTVRSLHAEKGKTVVTISRGGTEVRAELPPSHAAGIAVGDRLEISGTVIHPVIRKTGPADIVPDRKDFLWEHSLDMVGRS